MNRENNLGNKIKQLRKSLGLTQEQLAEKVGIDDKHLSKIENGLHLPTYKTIEKLSSALKTDLMAFEMKSCTAESPNPIYLKTLKILNTAKNDKEREYFFEVLRLAQKGLKLK